MLTPRELDEMRRLFEGGHLYPDVMGEIGARRCHAGLRLVMEVDRLRAVLEEIVSEASNIRDPSIYYPRNYYEVMQDILATAQAAVTGSS